VLKVLVRKCVALAGLHRSEGMLDCLATLAHRFFIGGFRTPAAE
jgi:hypothetical protein